MSSFGWGGLRAAGASSLKWWLLWVVLAIVLPPLAVFLFFGAVLSPPALAELARPAVPARAVSRIRSSASRGPPFSV
jgi:hypothetical protein